jgi:hypothetical protein
MKTLFHLSPRRRAASGGRAAACSALRAHGGGAALDVCHSLKLQVHRSSSDGGGGGGGGAAGGSGGRGACHALALESAVPLFAVGLACSRGLQLLDAPDNVAILSRCGPGRRGWPNSRSWGRRARVSALLPRQACGLRGRTQMVHGVGGRNAAEPRALARCGRTTARPAAAPCPHHATPAQEPRR